MLASIYKVPNPKGEDFTRVELPRSANRVGIMGHVSFGGSLTFAHRQPLDGALPSRPFYSAKVFPRPPWMWIRPFPNRAGIYKL